MRKQNLILLLAVLAILGSLAVLYRTQFAGRSGANTQWSEGLGGAAAEETAKLLRGQGRVVLILADTGNYQDPLMAGQRDAFAKTLARTPGMSLLATEKMETTAPGTMGTGGLNAGQFRAIIQRHATAAAFVSMVGFPNLPPEALEEMKGWKFIVVGDGGPELKALLEGGVVQVALIPRIKPVTATQPPATPREWFNRAYEIVTPANASNLP